MNDNMNADTVISEAYPLWRELDALLHFRIRIIAGELLYSKDAVTQALDAAHSNEKA